MIDTVARIKELMDKKKWTAYELAAQTDISTNAIYDWFKIGATPTLSNIVKVCEAMEISLEQFFCGDDCYKLNAEEQEISDLWFALTDGEKAEVIQLIKAFRISKSKM